MNYLFELAQWIVDLPRWVYEIAFAGYVIVVAGFVLLERRRPTATLAWILVLAFLPLVGLVTYLLLGRTRLRMRKRQRSRRSVQAMAGTRLMAIVEDIPPELPLPARGLIRLALKAGAAPLRRATTLELLSQPSPLYTALREAILGAHEYIHLQFYIWRDDASGRDIIELLAEQAKRGVRVRVLYDHWGSFGTQSSHFAPLRAAGGSVGIFGRLRLPVRFGTSHVNFRNHRKIVCVDGHIGFIGGLNIGNEYLGADDAPRWRDMQVRLTGDAVLGLDAIFLEDWLASTGEILDLTGARPPGTEGADGRRPAATRPGQTRRRVLRRIPPGANPFDPLPVTPVRSEGPLMQIIPSGPDNPVTGTIAAQFAAAIGAAQQRAWIATPYFIPEESMSLILRTAAMRGVDVRILVPAANHSDQRLVALASRSYYDDLLEAGCKVFEYDVGMLHAKYLVVDDWLAAIGSANMDVRSFHINYEVTAMVYDQRFVHDLAEIFTEDHGQSRQILPGSRDNLSVPIRLTEGFARMLSPLM